MTGANRGIGKVFAQELARRGARKVYAGVRDVNQVECPNVEYPNIVPLAVDVSDPASIAAAAANASDVTLLINNAGLLITSDPLVDDLNAARAQMEVNYLGTWAMIRSFAPIIIQNRGGAIVNMLSVSSWASSRIDFAAYSASKAAQWALTNSFRRLLQPKRVQVVGVHVGFVDTDMAANIKAEKTSPNEVVQAAIQGVEDNRDEVLVDSHTKKVKASLSTPQPAYIAPLPR